MAHTYLKMASAAGWLSAVTAVGLLGGVSTVSGWTFLAAFATLPPVMLLRYWTEPVPSMSESIQKALR